MTELKFTLPASALRPEAADGKRLHTAHKTDPLGPDSEQPWHMHAARYSALGYTPAEIAEACGVHINSVYRARNALWFQERVTAFMAEQDKDIMDLFRNARAAVAMRLIDLALTAKSEAVAVNAADRVLDRIMGKPLARVETTESPKSADPVAEVEALRQEIATLTKPL